MPNVKCSMFHGLQNGSGHVKFYPYEKGGEGAEKV